MKIGVVAASAGGYFEHPTQVAKVLLGPERSESLLLNHLAANRCGMRLPHVCSPYVILRMRPATAFSR